MPKISITFTSDEAEDLEKYLRVDDLITAIRALRQEADKENFVSLYKLLDIIKVFEIESIVDWTL